MLCRFSNKKSLLAKALNKKASLGWPNYSDVTDHSIWPEITGEIGASCTAAGIPYKSVSDFKFGDVVEKPGLEFDGWTYVDVLLQLIGELPRGRPLLIQVLSTVKEL